MARRSCVCLVVCAIWGLLGSGCAFAPYQYGRGWHNAQTAACAPPVTDAALEIAVGRPNRFVDGTGWVVGIPAKVLLWDRRVNNHHISSDTTAEVAEYLERNQLQEVCVRVNQYAPGDEWRRLCANREVGAGWRYSIGALSVLSYTVLPGRVFGYDQYNPYTNSLYMYSDVPSLGMQSAAYAKDLHRRDRPGTYAAVNELPVVALWHETIATRDALNYLHTTSDPASFREAERILEPYYGSRVGGAFHFVAGFGPLFEVGGALVGHMTSRLYPMDQPAAVEGEPDWVAAPLVSAEELPFDADPLSTPDEVETASAAAASPAE